ncbi:MAG: ABC transporter ATP-binding protein [Patescibacteria group bacterium]
MSILSIKNLKKSFFNNGRNVEVLDGVDLELERGEFLVIFGPNGCGKTTLLNIISKLENKDSGEVISEKSLKTSFVFQSYREAIFPWQRVIDNIAFPLQLKGVPKSERYDKVKSLIGSLGLKVDLQAYPYELSGGQQQMVAILRALIIQPDLLLLDEPFSSLDYKTTLLMEEKILEIWEQLHLTILFVTHEIDEAVLLSSRIALMSDKPSRIVKMIENDLQYPRHWSMVGSEEFSNLKQIALNTFMSNLGSKII